MNFSKQKNTQDRIDKILLKYNLNPLYNMSASGHFFVLQCKDKNNNLFILKVRKVKQEQERINFVNEILFNLFLQKNFFSVFPYDIIDFDIQNEPEYLLYKMIQGSPLNSYYFSIGKRSKMNLDIEKLVDLLFLLQKEKDRFLNFSHYIKLESHNFDYNFNFFQKRKEIYVKYCGKNKFQKAENILLKNKKDFDNNLVLAHGDLNPKNILIQDNNDIVLIDWTSLCLHNPLFDITMFYLAMWNAKQLQARLKAYSLQKLQNNEKLFNLNILILVGKFLEILDDTLYGIKDDFKKNRTNKENLDKITKNIKIAKQETIYVFNKSLEYIKQI